MWLFTPIGFYSVVADTKVDRLVVRARVEQDLLDLRTHYLPELSNVVTTTRRDYMFRAYTTRDALATAMARIALAISYGNFKDEVHATRPAARAPRP